MNDTPLRIAKREVQTLFSNPASWIGIGAAGVILGLVAPFDTDLALGLIPRLAYWLVVAAIGFLLGSTVSTFVAEFMRQYVNKWVAIVIAGACAGLANFAVLLLINWLVFRIGPSDREYVIGLAINVVVISIIIAGAYVSISSHIERGTTAPMSAPEPPRLLARLPIDKRGALISISVQDHYVDVVTDKGAELILLRLSDAMAEVGDTPGMQVHRSHWIATNAVAKVRRDGARAILTMANGRDIPASRTYIPALKEAGLLPG